LSLGVHTDPGPGALTWLCSRDSSPRGSADLVRGGAWRPTPSTRNATFGTVNENRKSGALERFLTPLNGRAIKLVLQRNLGRPHGDSARPDATQ
jgi:hypothetical protein